MNTGFEENNESFVGQSGSSQESAVSCGAILTIAAVCELQISLRESLKSVSLVRLDASKVERVDAAGLQLLCAFVRDAAASGKSIRWNHPSQTLISSAKLLRLDELLVLPMTESK
jgi:ABC-type transporter Mla MlaB component